jgi:aspartate/methionine/tyrosine aminotransferase
VLARARALGAQGPDHPSQIGEPDFTTPRHIIEAGAQALLDGNTHYCPAPGLPVLREACAAHLTRHRGLAIDPARVLVAPGAKPFLFFGVLATCDPGDEVGSPGRGLPIYEFVIRWAGATPVPLPLSEETGSRHRRRPRRVAGASDEARDPELAREPDRRHRDRELNAEIARLLADHSC